MIKLRNILNTVFLTEALDIETAKEYTSIKRNWNIQKRLDKIFNALKELPDASESKRGDRIYLPFYKNGEVKSSPIEKEISDALPAEYKLKDYIKGIVIDKFGRDVKLNKVLTKIGKSDLVNKVNTDKTRESSKVSEYVVVFSRHPYDIAGMSTDRGWDSCMNVYDGANARYVSFDIKEGTFICYITKENDKNLNNPVARVLVKPYINVTKKSDVLYSPETKYYGTAPTGFLEFVQNTLKTIQGSKVGKFKFLKGLYCDSGYRDLIAHTPDVQDILDGKAKATTRKQVIAILKGFGLTKGDYTINSDLSVDVNKSLNISNMALKAIPLKFRTVKGDFKCNNNLLTSLEGSPQTVRDFDCRDNKLTSLEGSPQTVRNFDCQRNKLTSLKGSPIVVKGDFRCSDNDLTSLEGAPTKVKGGFSCSNNLLRTLDGAPKYVGEWFGCANNQVKFTKAYIKKVVGLGFNDTALIFN